jgi:hypothetical protein
MMWISRKEFDALKERVSELEWKQTRDGQLDDVKLKDIIWRLLSTLNLSIGHIYPGFTLEKKGGPEKPQDQVKGLYDR